MATIYYLNWDKERDNNGPATELFHDLHVNDAPEHIDIGAFDELYRRVADDVGFYADVADDRWAEFCEYLGRGDMRGRYADIEDGVVLRVGCRHEAAVPVVVPERFGSEPSEVELFMPTFSVYRAMAAELVGGEG